MTRSSPAAHTHRSAHRTTRRWAAATVVAVAALTAASCSSAAGDAAEPTTPDPDASSDAGSSAADSTAQFPVTVDNCGTAVTVEAPPARVVTIKSTSTEMLLALGLEDAIVGTAFADGPVPAEYEAAYAGIPVLSAQVPGKEALLELAPDFVYAGWESNFAADAAGDRAELGELGIGTYVAPAACKDPDYQPDPLTFDDVFGEIREVASLFGVPARAEELIEAQEGELAAVTPPTEPTTALWYSSGTDTPYVGAGIGAPQMVLEAAGLTNIFADVDETWTSAGWEQIVAADPDVIVLVDAAWNTAASKIDLLEANPATSQLTAVRERRYLSVPFPAAEAGVRSTAAVTSLTEQLADLTAAG